MTNEFIYIFVCIVSVAFCSFISYNGAEAGESKFALSSILLASLAIPFISSVSSLSDIDFTVPDIEYGGIYGGAAEDAVEDAFCRGIKLAVADKFSLEADHIEVECISFDMEKMSAEAITVKLSEEAVYADSVGIEKYITNENFGKCEVILDFE